MAPTAIVNACPACGVDVPVTSSFCPACGSDLGLVAAQPSRRGQTPWFGLVGLALVAILAAGGWLRYRVLGPGPDLPTTLRWLVLGDGGRHGELETLARGYETARAVERLCLDSGVPENMARVDWHQVARYSNDAWRGFTSLVGWAAGPSAMRGRLARLLAVNGRDGWDRGWRSTLAPWPDAGPPAGFYPGMLAAGDAPPPATALLHLTLLSAGKNGVFGDGDDLMFEAVFPAPQPLRVDDYTASRQREFDLDRGLVWVRWSGTQYDIIDSHILGEFYLTSEHGE